MAAEWPAWTKLSIGFVNHDMESWQTIVDGITYELYAYHFANPIGNGIFADGIELVIARLNGPEATTDWVRIHSVPIEPPTRREAQTVLARYRDRFPSYLVELAL